MTWEPELADLDRRLARARELGGAAAVEKHHARGKLTARERIALLLDPDSFREFGALAGQATYEGDELVEFTPKPHVDGFGRVDGRRVVVSAGDFTIKGGSASAGAVHGALGAEPLPQQRARDALVPYIRLLDSAGGSVRGFESLGRTYLPDGNTWSTVDVELLNLVPVVSAVLGSVAGLPAVDACLAHWNVMVRGTSHLFPGGPPVVKAGLGLDVTKDELGGWEIHAKVSGSVDCAVDTEEEALDKARQFLSYLPSNVFQLPPRGVTDDAPDRRDDALASLIPRNPRQIYDPYALLRGVLDAGSFFEIAELYGRGRITGLARVNGFPVGVMANNPRYVGGATDVDGGDKVIRLIQLCETFHLPLVSFADEPGFMVGVESERRGIERAGARLVFATCTSTIPWITFVVRRLYGVGGQCHHRPSGLYRRYAWPSARWGSMHIAGGADAAYRREIESADDPDAKRAEIEERLERLASPFRTAEATGQDIIDPRDTRALLAEFVEDAQPVLAARAPQARLAYRP